MVDHDLAVLREWQSSGWAQRFMKLELAEAETVVRAAGGERNNMEVPGVSATALDDLWTRGLLERDHRGLYRCIDT